MAKKKVRSSGPVKMPFGPYEGKPLSAVRTAHLRWFVERHVGTLPEGFEEAASAELAKRKD